MAVALGDIDECCAAGQRRSRAGFSRPAAGTFDLTLPEAVRGAARRRTTSCGHRPEHCIDSVRFRFRRRRPGVLGLDTRDGRRELTLQAAGAYCCVGVGWTAACCDRRCLPSPCRSRRCGARGRVAGRLVSRRPRAGAGESHRSDGARDGRRRLHRAHSDRAIETELGQLARALNGAFDRLHASLERQRRFTADASHELRTPLATLATEAHWALGRARAPDEYRRSLEVCQRAATRMQDVVERLLALARAEVARDEELFLPVDLDEIAQSVVRDLRPLAEARRLAVSVATTPARCQGNRDRLLGALTNVVANAIEYQRRSRARSNRGA